MPHTILGKWSVSLIGVFFVLLGVFFILVNTGQRGGDTFFSNLWLTIPMLIAGTCGFASLVTGVIAVIKKERGWLIYPVIAIGLFVTWFIGAELLFPH